MSGSKNMSYDSANLTTPDIKWLGLRPSDFDKCGALSVPPLVPGTSLTPLCPCRQVRH